MLHFLKLQLPGCHQNMLIRALSVFSPANQKNTGTPLKVFDRKTKLLQKERAAVMEDHKVFDYLKEEVGYRLADRIFDIKKEMIKGLDLGCGKGFASKHILDMTLKELYMADMSPRTLEMAEEPEGILVKKQVIDEEQPLPFDTKALDIVISNMSLHWVNDLPGCLKEVYRILKPDGVFLGSMFGCETLYELRSAFVLAELEREGGFASHLSPFTQIRDIGGVLNQAGFSLLTIDTDEIIVNFPSMFELMWDLKGMAENNASVNRKLHLHRETLMAAAAIYEEMYGKDGSVPATFQIIYMIGWKLDPNKPVSQAERGSATARMKDINRLTELVNEQGMEGKLQFMQELEKLGRKGDDKNDGKE